MMTERGYRSLKKRLNRYHRFSFVLPKKGKNLSPQQKGAITRIAKKLLPFIKRVESERSSFIVKPRGVNIASMPQTMHTNKGFFYPRPGAQLKIKKIRGRKKANLEVRYKEIVEKLFLFPVEILGNMELIEEWVEYLEKKYKPEYILWAVNNFMGTVRYAPELFFQYAGELMEDKKFKKDFRKAKRQRKNFLTGVYLGYRRYVIGS